MSVTGSETVLVTGASSGIGLELAKCFAAEKSDLILTARNREALDKLASELRDKFQIQVHVIIADLAQPESPGRLFDEIGKLAINVDVLVNNAGFGLHGSFAELPLQRQMEIIQVNISALVELTGLFLPGMIQRRRGGILNVGSVAGFLPGPNMAIYYATKAFVMSFSEALREELRGAGVTVTDLCPGPTETNFSQVARSHRVRKVRAAKMPAAEVARIGHAEFRQGRCLSIPGAKNKVLIALTQLLPRRVLAKLSAHYNKLDK
jgi:short-subunit dehydrogenase